jgi:hypothetical protein
METQVIISLIGIIVPSLTSLGLLILRQREKRSAKQLKMEMLSQLKIFQLQREAQLDCKERIEKLEKLLRKSSSEKGEIREEKEELIRQVHLLTINVEKLKVRIADFEKENVELKMILKKKLYSQSRIPKK